MISSYNVLNYEYYIYIVIIFYSLRMAKGTVKLGADSPNYKGYGFIKTSESEKDVFYHERNLKGELASRKLMSGDEVTFDIEMTEKGTNATNIKLAGAEAAEETDTVEDMASEESDTVEDTDTTEEEADTMEEAA